MKITDAIAGQLAAHHPLLGPRFSRDMVKQAGLV
jgi:hypothetical protein